MINQANHRIAVYIPSTLNGNEPAPSALVSEWVTTAKKTFAELFGGYTAYRAVGGWISPIHGLVEEPVVVVASHTDDHGLSLVGEVKAFAASVASGLQQEAVSVEVDNALQFVSPLSVAA